MIFFTEVFGKKLNFKCSQKYQNNELGLKQWQNNYSSINQTKIQTQQIFELMIGDGIQSVFRNPLWEIKQKLQRYPTKRWGHTATINKNKLYIYGGKTGKTKEPIYELDLDTLQSQIFDINGFPEARESHSCALIKDKLIIWGGCRQEKALNDCLAITFKDQLCIWSPITQFTILKERESHATTVLRDKYIFLYGGSNEDEMYEDFWAYNAEQEIWYEIRSITGKMTKRLGCTLTTIKNKIYMFGGETEDEKYQNQIYRLTLSEIQFNSKDRIPELKCQLITPTTKNCPAGRTSHSALCYNDRYLIIIGGQGQGFDSKGKPASVLFNDMWCFDTEENSWQLIQIPNQNIFKPRSCFSANIYRNKIFIFGGLISLQNFKSSDELIIFSFSQPQQKSLDSCNICKLHYKPIQVKASEKPIPSISPLKDSFNFGLSSLFKLSRMIKNPFDAACLIIEAYVKMSYGSMFLDLNQNRYILIQGSDVMISKQKFTKIAFNYSFVTESVQQDPLISQTIQDRIADENLQIFGFNLKNGCSRLGKNFAFINQRNNYLDLLLFTEENIFYAEYNIKQRMVGPQQEKSFQIIKNYLDRNCINLNYIQNATFSIVISELYKLSPTQNQLIVNDKGHIQIANSFKKVSLQSYCSTLFLKKPLFQLSINNVSVEFRDIQNQYAKFPFQTSFSNDFGAIKLKESQKEGVINYYRRGIRVGKFIKINPPFLRGYVEISPKYELDLLRYRIENTKSIDFQLKNICQQKLSNGNKRKNPTSIRELEELSRKI